ncbi:MAG TPA: protein BatD [candidate division WOR-3 bacterium]|uniref:Protein BatD n=1 Tax=candidate division WOR-3 bacterium TaxID=2052148 RepID=A0A7V0T4F6_UNCW3|nr:protein BatD [candidate division WOR-3 bacterium]
MIPVRSMADTGLRNANPRPVRRGRLPVCCLLLALGIGSAAALEFRASVDRTRVGVGQRFTLTVTVSGSGLGRIPRPELPDLSDFDQLGSTSSQSTNIFFSGGRMTREETVSFIYQLAARREGELTIGPCRLSHGGNTYSTGPVTVTVVGADQSPSPARSAPAAPLDPFAPPAAEPVSTDEVQLIAGADRTDVWQGEQVTVTWTFYTRARVADLKLAQVPPFSGFWAEKLFDADRLDYQSRRLGEVEYSAATLKRVALFPTGPGRLEVGAMRIAGRAVRRGGFFFETTEPFEASSRPIAVTVRPLPDSGRPASFSGGVGAFAVSAELDRDSSDAGTPVNLVVRVEGAGNIQLIGAPKLPPVHGLRVLNPETRDRISRTGNRVRGTREFIYPLIPQSNGRHAAPAVEFGFFDPAEGGYYVRTTPRLEFVATGVQPVAARDDKEEDGMRVVSTDIRHIKGEGSRVQWFDWSGAGLPGRVGWLFYPAGLVLLGLGVALGRHRRRLEADRGYARSRRAAGLARRRLAAAARALRAGREAEFYAALAAGVAGYVGDRHNIEVAGMTGDELSAALAARGVAADTARRLLELIRTCEMARYSPGLVSCRPDELLDQARELLEKL